jgi:hypothetical protein
MSNLFTPSEKLELERVSCPIFLVLSFACVGYCTWRLTYQDDDFITIMTLFFGLCLTGSAPLLLVAGPLSWVLAYAGMTLIGPWSHRSW